MSAVMGQVLDMTPRWDAVGWVVTHSMRDVIDRRYGLLPEVSYWFKPLALFRETERESMILKEVTAEHWNFHKSKGLKVRTPECWKSIVLRVATVRS